MEARWRELKSKMSEARDAVVEKMILIDARIEALNHRVGQLEHLLERHRKEAGHGTDGDS